MLKANDVPIIETEKDYKDFLKEIELLMDSDPAPKSPEGKRLQSLVFSVSCYEEKRFIFPKPTPIQAIKFRMKEGGLKPRDLVRCIGNKSAVSEVLSGKKKITLKMARALNKHLGIPLAVFFQEE